MSKTLFAAAMILCTCLSAQTPTPAPLACDGRAATVRISEITAAGSVKGFLEAVAAHKAWVSSHGLTKDEITTVPMIERDEKTRVRSYSNKQFLSIHVHGATAGPGPKHDEAYDAFVKLYRDNSDVKASYDVCLPTAALK